MTFQPLMCGGQVVYSAKSGAPFPEARAQEIGEHINTLGSEITPQMILEDARIEASPIHDLFDWDDDLAAEKWRLSTARKIINHLTIRVVNVELEEERDVRAFFNVKATAVTSTPSVTSSETSDKQIAKTSPKRFYVNTTKAIKEPDYHAQVIANAKRELDQWRKRYQTYRELDPVMLVIEKYLLQG